MNYWHLLLALVVCFPGLSDAKPVKTDEVEAELIAENESFRPGLFDNWVALKLRPQPGWHVYWRNPGDSGIPTQIEWQLPSGMSAGAMQWPYPHQESLGELTNYGYSEETLHLIPIQVADTGLKTLRAKAKWLVCKDICIPGEADLSLDVNVVDAPPQPQAAWQAAFARSRSQIPLAAPEWEAAYTIADGDFSLHIGGAQFSRNSRFEFFPLANDLLMHAAAQRIEVDSEKGLRLSQQLSAYFESPPEPLEGVLVVHEENQPARAFQLRAQAGTVDPVPLAKENTKAEAQAELKPIDRAATHRGIVPTSEQTLPLILLFALLGGLILNLMPCVFPVLAIKALSVMNARGESLGHRQAHALSYTVGVITTFLLVAAVLIGLRTGGQALGWGFQLQSPAIVFALTVVIFAMGLSLSGLANFGSRWMGVGQNLASKPGLTGSFFTGALAVVVATPCSAPFMATALGFALIQTTPVALLVFAALGLGLALPFLLIGFIPALAAVLPKPGVWMETFKQLMAFPLYLTAVWLIWVLGGLTDRDGMAIAMIGLVLVAIAVWGFARARSGIGQGLAMLALFAAIALSFHPSMKVGTDKVQNLAQGWQPYSDARFEALRAQGRSVFVDFTADWCLTCKINERAALRSEKVRDLFRRHDVVLLVADWTRADPAITATLARYGRSGVPLYLASRDGADPVVLPQILTADILISAFE